MGLASVSVDLDSLVHYCRIHGVPESALDARGRTAAYEVGLPRLMELFSKAGLSPTLFAIGEDLEAEGARELLAQAHRAGAEVGNHSYRHDYALSRRPPEQIRDELEGAAQAIWRATGERPAGFRAPGYTLSPALYRAICEAGHAYDSSVFPAVPYYAAKAAVMGALALARRPSRAVLDTPAVLLAPRRPYLPSPDAPYRRGRGPVLELPVATVPWTRLPFIGTLAVAVPGAVLRAAYRTLKSEPLLNLELHALDALDETDGIPQAVARQQRDARIPHLLKLERLGELLRWLRDDFEIVTLRTAAQKLAPRAAGLV